jgi:uncharacterized protein YecE (DUF72 family)
MNMLRIGTSGWHYKHWRGVFYPAGMPPRDYLPYYAGHFDTVELNGVFYRLPKPEAVRGWARVTPDHFLFAYKGSRYITHMKKLLDPGDALKEMFSRAVLLKEKLAVILWQLPPSLRADTRRLRVFFDHLPHQYRHVVEFRDASWYTPEIFQLMDRHQIGLCLHDMRGRSSPIEVTSKLVYIRFHGTEEKKYNGRYTITQLMTWAAHIRKWLKGGHDVFAYFNNDPQGNAVLNARQLKELLKEKTDAPPARQRDVRGALRS